jgi:hypothetical protein
MDGCKIPFEIGATFVQIIEDSMLGRRINNLFKLFSMSNFSLSVHIPFQLNHGFKNQQNNIAFIKPNNLLKTKNSHSGTHVTTLCYHLYSGQ